MAQGILSATLRLTTNVGKAALTKAADLWSAIDDKIIVQTINQVAEKFEPITVPVKCQPVSADLNNYAIIVDMSDLETALDTGRLVRPYIVVSAATKDLDRTILTDRLIEAFSPILVTHAERMDTLRKRRETRLDRERFATSVSGAGGIFEFFMSSILFAMMGLGALVGPIMWLLIAFGGIAILSELPRLAFNLMKKMLGLPIFDQPEDVEIHQLKKDLERYRPLLEKMVEKTIIIEDPVLTAQHHNFTM